MTRHPSLDDRFDPAVCIVDHDPSWGAAVPGLAAKPILDLQLSVASIDPLAPYAQPLERLGYLFVADPQSPDYRLFARPPRRPRSHHPHVCEAGSIHELRHLAVRDFLREHAGEAAAYAAFKRDLVARHPRDRLAYIEGKAGFMAALEERALRARAYPP